MREVNSLNKTQGDMDMYALLLRTRAGTASDQRFRRLCRREFRRKLSRVFLPFEPFIC